jgi:hypothetical protein
MAFEGISGSSSNDMRSLSAPTNDFQIVKELKIIIQISDFNLQEGK